MRVILLFFGVLLPVVSSAAYAVSILKGKSRPQRMTRLLLVCITALMVASLIGQGDTSGVWLALVSFVQALGIWVLSLTHGIGGRSRLDFACMGVCALGLGLWMFFGGAWIGLLASIVADIAASLPALVKTVRMPHTELLAFYAWDTLAGLLVAIAGPFTLKAALFPLYIALINALFAVVIWLPRLRSAQTEGEVL